MHLYIQMNLKNAGLISDFEAPINKIFTGFTDGIMYYKDRQCVLEIKTMNTFQFKKLTAPLHDHVNQATIYAKTLGIDWILFIYYDKNGSDMKHYLVKADTNWFNRLVKRVKEVSSLRLKNNFKHGKGITKHELPERACKARHTEKAMKCPFVNTCYAAKS